MKWGRKRRDFDARACVCLLQQILCHCYHKPIALYPVGNPISLACHSLYLCTGEIRPPSWHTRLSAWSWCTGLLLLPSGPGRAACWETWSCPVGLMAAWRKCQWGRLHSSGTELFVSRHDTSYRVTNKLFHWNVFNKRASAPTTDALPVVPCRATF